MPPTWEVETEGRKQFEKAREEVFEVLPKGKNHGGWRRMSKIDFEDLHAFAYRW